MIIINDNYAYGSDSYNFIIYKRSDDRNSWISAGFYGSFKMMLNGLKKKIALEHLEDLTKLEKKLDEFKAWITENVIEQYPKKAIVNESD